jgi:ABC-type sulfate transport system substrate-binding protein
VIIVLEEIKMTFINSRLVVSLFIFMVSLGAAYGMLQPLTHDSARDPSQKLHTELNDAFTKYWKERTGTDVSVRQARSKSGKTVDATVDGLDITALDLSYDGNTLGKKARFVPPEWKPLSQNSPYASPYISTIVFWYAKAIPRG